MAMLFVIGVTFAMTFVFNRLAITHGVPLIPYVGWQAFGGALILLIVCAVKGEFPRISPQNASLPLSNRYLSDTKTTHFKPFKPVRLPFPRHRPEDAW